MKKYLIILIMLFPMMSYATCNGSQKKSNNISVTLTDGEGSQNFNTNFDGDFTCHLSTDKMYMVNALQNYIVELYDISGEKPIYIKLNASVEGDFPIDTPSSSIFGKQYSAASLFNTKNIVLKMEYVDAPGNVNLRSSNVNTFTISDAIIFSSNSSCSWQNILACFGLNASFAQSIIFNVTHQPTTCKFLQSDYSITLPNISINDLHAGRYGGNVSDTLKLECNGVNNVATNPVTLKISSGDWSDDGLTLKNTLADGAQGVGFNIYSGSDTSIPLKNGSVLKRIKKMGVVDKYYNFIVSTRYARINGESLRTGKVQSKVVFTIAYD